MRVAGLRDINQVIEILSPPLNSDPWLAFAHVLQSPDCRILLPAEDKLVFCQRTGPAQWDVHVHGDIGSVIEAGLWMFRNENCEVLSWVPDNPSVARWARRLVGLVGAEKQDQKYILRRESCLQLQQQ